MAIGKWIAGTLGWIMFGPIGGLVGYFLASAFESDDTPAGKQQGQRNSFFVSLLVLATAVIKADGKISSKEIATLRQFFARNFGPAAADEAEKIVRELMNKDINLYDVCQQIRTNMNHSQRLQLYHFLVSLAACDGLHQSEVDVLEVIATYLGLSESEADSIFAIFRPNNDSNYRILEIEPTATDEEVKKAYRRMAVKYHPDKVATLGPDVQKAAEEKFKAVSTAYEAICKERGI